jgi:small subunit ribosomal protein S16
MVKIRLALRGKKKNAYFHIVAVDEKKARNGQNLELLGSYNPRIKEPKEKSKLDMDKYRAWIARGAQPTETVVQIVKLSSI